MEASSKNFSCIFYSDLYPSPTKWGRGRCGALGVGAFGSHPPHNKQEKAPAAANKTLL